MSLFDRNKEKNKVKSKVEENGNIIVNELSDDELVNIAGGITYTPEETAQVREAISAMKALRMPSA